MDRLWAVLALVIGVLGLGVTSGDSGGAADLGRLLAVVLTGAGFFALIGLTVKHHRS